MGANNNFFEDQEKEEQFNSNKGKDVQNPNPTSENSAAVDLPTLSNSQHTFFRSGR
jgi:hypothetical protein